MIAWYSHALSRPIESGYSGRSVLNRTKAAVSPMHSGYFLFHKSLHVRCVTHIKPIYCKYILCKSLKKI